MLSYVIMIQFTNYYASMNSTDILSSIVIRAACPFDAWPGFTTCVPFTRTIPRPSWMCPHTMRSNRPRKRARATLPTFPTGNLSVVFLGGKCDNNIIFLLVFNLLNNISIYSPILFSDNSNGVLNGVGFEPPSPTNVSSPIL